jgi:hypothetical protein
VALALAGLQAGGFAPFAFMVLHGLGLYLPYIAVQTTVFERLLAMTRDTGNVGYLVYLADAFGYLGYVAVMLARNVLGPTENFLPFFLALSWAIAGACVVLLIPCWRYFATRPATCRLQVVDYGSRGEKAPGGDPSQPAICYLPSTIKPWPPEARRREGQR